MKAPKTLITAGTYRINPVSGLVDYHLHLFGQSPESPAASFIGTHAVSHKSYGHLMDDLVDIYAKHFNTDQYNLVTIDLLSPAPESINRNALEKQALDLEASLLRLREGIEKRGRKVNEDKTFAYDRARLIGMLEILSAIGINTDSFKWIYNV